MEFLMYAVSRAPRPVLAEEFPLWFAVVLLVGLLCAAALLGSALVRWCVALYRR